MESERIDARRKSKDARDGDKETRGHRDKETFSLSPLPPVAVSPSEPHIYLYCFFKGATSLPPQKGIDGVNATLVLCYRDLCALVSPVPSDEYNEETLNRRIEDLEWLIPRIRRHEEIVRHVAGLHPVIPIRFGAIYGSNERVLGVLRSRYDEFRSHLDLISGKEEWGVKVYAEKGAGRETIGASSEVVGELDERISSAKSAGEAYLLRKKRANLIRQQSADFLIVMSDRIYKRILPWSVEGRRNKVLNRNATGKEGDMILNAAFLLDRLDVEAFKEKVNALAKSYQRDALSFEVSGPWPCYNFCPDMGL